MKTFSVFMALLAACVAGTAGEWLVQQDSGRSNSITLTAQFISQLAEEMRSNHPALLAAYARTNAAAANAKAVRAWEDPVAHVGGMAAREAMRADEGDLLYGVEQKLPLFGKPGLARRVARADQDIESANADYQFQTLRTQLAKAAFRTALADQVVSLGEQDLGWMETARDAAENKYRAGQATLVEVLQLQNERDRRTVQLQTDRNEANTERLGLNRRLNRNLQSPWPRFELPPVAGPVIYNQKLADLALGYEPKIIMLQKQVKQAEAAADMTRRQRWPDISTGFEARNYSGDGSFRQGMLVLSMNIPWGNAAHYRNDIQRDLAKVKAAQSDLADYQLSLREEVHRLTAKIDAARREAIVYRDGIVPRTQSAFDSARSDWEANRGSLRDLLDARRMLFDGRLMYARAVAEQYEMLSELVLCCGQGDLGSLEMIGAAPETPQEGIKP